MRRGELIHDWLARISWIEDGVPEAAALIQSTPEIAREFESRTAAEMARSLIAEVQTAGTELHRAFSKARTASGEKLELWQERRFAILDTSAGRPELLTGSFDRVVLWRDAAGKVLRAEIMDFKTDRFDSPEDRAQIEARYAPQLEAYRKALCLLCTGLAASAVAISLVFVRIGEEGHSA
jgi:ATP-dependent helicase/nuclease subunit A